MKRFDPRGPSSGARSTTSSSQQGQWNQNQEMDVLTQAMYQRASFAMTRMKEADQLAATASSACASTLSRHELGQRPSEFIGSGKGETAVRHREVSSTARPNGRPVHERPLTGQDFYNAPVGRLSPARPS